MRWVRRSHVKQVSSHHVEGFHIRETRPGVKLFPLIPLFPGTLDPTLARNPQVPIEESPKAAQSHADGNPHRVLWDRPRL